MSDIDYDTYYVKHCVRYYGWLPAAKKFNAELRRRSLKYLTLCARQAIDVFMLEMHKLLLRDESGNLPNVVICEKGKNAAMEILNLVRPPLKEAIFQGALQDILLFQDDEHTRGLSPGQYVRSFEIRKRLRIKELSKRLKMFFPFDIINFDPHENLLNPDLNNNKMYQSLKKIFELQEQIDNFLLFVTTPIFDIHSDSESRLKDEFESNVSLHTEIRDALQSLFGTPSYHDIDENKKIAISFTKSVVISAAKGEGWDHKHHGIFVYENLSRKKMLSSVVQFSKVHTISDESVYVDDIIQIIEQMPKYYSYEDSIKNQEVKEHLEKIKKYREKIRNEYRVTP